MEETIIKCEKECCTGTSINHVETKRFKDWFADLFSNPDGSGSTKRTIAWMLIFVDMIFGMICTFIDVNQSVFDLVFISLLTAGLSALGLSTVDYNIGAIVERSKKDYMSSQVNNATNGLSGSYNNTPNNNSGGNYIPPTDFNQGGKLYS
jgi:hypothetical protein